MKRPVFVSAVALALCTAPTRALPCTNFLITPGASEDGSSLITYAADSHTMYGELYYTPSADHEPGAVRSIVDWDTGKTLGSIPQIAHTFSVVGNINEHQVAIGETTFGGRPELHDPKGLIDYGSLLYVALERARTAREAIQIMTDLVAEYGYYSSGESFSISDPREVWLLEMIGKGPDNRGAVWAARQIPDGYVSAHANQSRIRSFDAQTLHSPDVISFARDRGYFNGPDHDFSFADAYAPLSFTALRICEARVWSFFRRITPSLELDPAWAMGDASAEPLPLWIKPDTKLSVHRSMRLMRDHFEASPMDLHTDLGAGPYEAPYRWRPLFWDVDGVKHFNERSTATQQTGFSFVAQSRSTLPGPVGGILWFGVDDANTTVYVPMYAGIVSAPKPFAVGTGDFNTFSWDSAFWTFNVVSNFAYGRYRDMARDIGEVQQILERSFLETVPHIDAEAVKLHGKSPSAARDYLTSFSHDAAKLTHDRWKTLVEQLVVKYMDGNVRDARGKVTHPGYPKSWYQRIAQTTGERYRYVKLPGEIGYYTSRKELGERAAAVPKSFDFAKEKLWLLSGTAKCGQPPQCCLPTFTEGESLHATIKRSAPANREEAEQRQRCGEAGWLVRVPRTEKRDVVPHYEMKSPDEAQMPVAQLPEGNNTR